MVNPVNQNQLVVPGTENQDLCTTLIKVNGSQLPDIVQIKSIRVSRCANRLPFAVLSFLDGDVATRRFPVSDTDLLSPGHSIEIHCGYHGNNNLIFKGIIIKHTVKIQQASSSLIEIECKDEAVKMSVGRKNKYFYNRTDSDVMGEILRSRSIQNNVEDTPGNHLEIVQYNASDWDFIVMRAEANAMLVLVKDGVVEIKKPDFTQQAKFPVQFGSTLIDFEGEMDARDQYPTIKVRTWNPDDQEVAESTPEGTGGVSGGFSVPTLPPAVGSAAQSAGGAIGLELPGTPPNLDYTQVMGLSHWNLQHTGHLKSEETQQWAKAQELKSKLAKKRGRLSFQGIADIYPGEMISLDGVGERHKGNVLLTAITHDIHDGQWLVHAQFGLSQKWFAQEFDDIREVPAAGLIPAANGLQIGIVTGLENDPENAHRIQVRLPLLDHQGDGSWMRIACQDAGNNRGSFWRPEVNDEVLVGFLDDDPRQPVVLGMLNSTAKPAPLSATDDNHQKGWVTRSGMKWIFDDDKKSMTLETPVGKKVIVDEDGDKIHLEDDHGNKITMDANGIVIESAKNMTLKAADDFKIEAKNIKEEAQSNFEAKGLKSKLTASGDVVIQGSTVKIN